MTFSPIYLDDPAFPDPIVPASQSEAFMTLHAQMCAATGADPTYISVRRVVDWLAQKKAKAANA